MHRIFPFFFGVLVDVVDNTFHSRRNVVEIATVPPGAAATSLNLFVPKPQDNPNGRGTIFSVYIPLDNITGPNDLNQIVSNSNVTLSTKKDTFRACLNLDEKKYINDNLIYKNASDKKK